MTILYLYIFRGYINIKDYSILNHHHQHHLGLKLYIYIYIYKMYDIEYTK
jgi:hypothetical protein